MRHLCTGKNKKPGLQKEAGFVFLMQQDTRKNAPLTRFQPALVSVVTHVLHSKNVRPFFTTSKRKGRSRDVVSACKLYTTKNLRSQHGKSRFI